MDLFTYLMTKKGHKLSTNDEFSYLLGRGNQEYTTKIGTTIDIKGSVASAMTIELKPHELTQDETPTPEDPQEVHVITGDNTIHVSNGKTTTDYSINLGSIEYCKIGNYQDSIFYNTADTNLDLNSWYIKKEIGKVVLDSNTGLQLRNTSANGTYTYSMNTPFEYKIEQSSTGNTLCPYFQHLKTVAGVGKMYDDLLDVIGISLYYNATNLTARSVYINSNVDKATLFTNNTIPVYFVLSSPTYTKITDSNLIEELETTMNSKDKRTIITQTNDDLPFIIKATIKIK